MHFRATVKPLCNHKRAQYLLGDLEAFVLYLCLTIV